VLTVSPVIPATTNLKAKAIRRCVALMLLFSGVALLGYAGFQYGAMLYEQRQLQALWRVQQDRALEQRQMADGILTRISIPTIEFSAVIVEGTDLYSLMIGPGHLTGTAEPGEPGNAVVSAHRDTFFHNIMKLNRGDRIVVERNGRSLSYVVEDFRIVQPDDISVTAPTKDNRLTLITCDPAYYPGPAPQRLVVISKLISAEAASLSLTEAKQPRSQIQGKRVAAQGIRR
jgi:sortase A